MQLLLAMMNSASKTSTLLEDVFLTVGAITSAIDGQFIRYMDAFVPFLVAALRNHEEHAVHTTIFDLTHRCVRSQSEQSVT